MKKTPSNSGRWQPGQSGNPGGRKAGDSDAKKFREMIRDSIPEIITVVANAAKGGNLKAAQLLLERAVPLLKATDEILKIDLPTTSLGNRAMATIDAVTFSEIAPSQGAEIIKLLLTAGKLLELDDLCSRIEKLERLYEQHSKQD